MLILCTKSESIRRVLVFTFLLFQEQHGSYSWWNKKLLCIYPSQWFLPQRSLLVFHWIRWRRKPYLFTQLLSKLIQGLLFEFTLLWDDFCVGNQTQKWEQPSKWTDNRTAECLGYLCWLMCKECYRLLRNYSVIPIFFQLSQVLCWHIESIIELIADKSIIEGNVDKCFLLCLNG